MRSLKMLCCWFLRRLLKQCALFFCLAALFFCSFFIFSFLRFYDFGSRTADTVDTVACFKIEKAADLNLILYPKLKMLSINGIFRILFDYIKFLWYT